MIYFQGFFQEFLPRFYQKKFLPRFFLVFIQGSFQEFGFASDFPCKIPPETVSLITPGIFQKFISAFFPRIGSTIYSGLLPGVFFFWVFSIGRSQVTFRDFFRDFSRVLSRIPSEFSSVIPIGKISS